MPEYADKVYSNFSIDRKQAQALAYMVLNCDIEQFISENREEYELFLQNEKPKRKGGEKND